MTDTTIFVIRLILFAGIHSLLALPQIKQLLIRDRQSRNKTYRLFYNLISLVLFGWAMTAFRNSPVLYVAPGIWSLLMYLMQTIFLAILVSCIRQTGVAEFLGLPKSNSSNILKTQLVTSGWYGIVRHPLYLFSMLFLIFNPVVTSRWLILTLFSFAYFIIGALIEERRLLRDFGNEYKLYRQRVPFLVPALTKSCHSTSPESGQEH